MKKTFQIILITCGLIFIVACGLTACQTETKAPPTSGDLLPTAGDHSEPLAVAETSAEQQSEQPPQEETPDASVIPTSVPTESEPDLETIEAEWQSSPHSNTYVVDTQGQNNTCAQCHSPIDWMPSMETLPESCFACKFELKDPPPLIPESEWEDIPCNVCHEVDKKNNVQPEYAWLEIAPLEEYTAVASQTELCLKCHAPVEIPGHFSVEVGGAHPANEYPCTGCHSAHSTSISCDATGCHSDIIEPVTPIAGHDADHQAVSCVACHDGNGMEVGPDEETGLWITFVTVTVGESVERFGFTSHNVVLEARCDRCHFANNPWGLSENVEEP